MELYLNFLQVYFFLRFLSLRLEACFLIFYRALYFAAGGLNLTRLILDI